MFEENNFLKCLEDKNNKKIIISENVQEKSGKAGKSSIYGDENIKKQ